MSMVDVFFDNLANMFGGTGFSAVVFKLLLASVIGGIIGLERGVHRQPAGFRTYILVCLGSCIAMMTDQYIVEFISGTADPARLGAQVITGVGFLGAGTIVLAGRQVIGLTTAAGLWASACIGLAVGIGFFSAAIIAAILIIIALAFLPNIEHFINAHSSTCTYHIEIDDARKFMDYVDHLASIGVEVRKSNVSKTPAIIDGGISFRMTVERANGMTLDDLERSFMDFEGVYIVEEL